MEASPIFVKTFDMIVWLLNHTKGFPKHQRFVMGKRMEEAALDFQDSIVKATKLKKSITALFEADSHLDISSYRNNNTPTNINNNNGFRCAESQKIKDAVPLRRDSSRCYVTL